MGTIILKLWTVVRMPISRAAQQQCSALGIHLRYCSQFVYHILYILYRSPLHINNKYQIVVVWDERGAQNLVRSDTC